MELDKLNLTDEQLAGVNEYLKETMQSEGDKIRTKYSKEIEDYEKLNTSYKELAGKHESLTNELLELREYKAKNEEKIKEDNIKSMLKNNGLDSGLVEYLNIGDKNGEELESYIKGLASVVNSKPKDFKPNKSNNNVKGNITKEDFNKMNYLQKLKLYQENKELYDILSK